MNRLTWWSRSEEATLSFGEQLGRALAAPAWIGLCGPLGAGKTRMVQGVARGLGFQGRVRSPSYVLEHRYRGRVSIRHLDLYRLEEAGEDLRVAWEEDNEEAVVLVEWAGRVQQPPPGALWIHLEPAAEPTRWIRLEWSAQDSPLRDFRLEGLLA
jgi:tRNA threonylcarbamoyladenosine biosynthesis protein TsaE